MKRFHVHVSVADLETSIRYYQALFGCAPSVRKSDYAKWMLEDPRLNFAISQRGAAPGLDHLGLQADSAEELDEIGARLTAADAVSLAERAAVCCYAISDKFWSEDPQGLRWESFRSIGASVTYAQAAAAATSGCCATTAATASTCAPVAAPAQVMPSQSAPCCSGRGCC